MTVWEEKLLSLWKNLIYYYLYVSSSKQQPYSNPISLYCILVGASCDCICNLVGNKYLSCKCVYTVGNIADTVEIRGIGELGNCAYARYMESTNWTYANHK